MLLIQKRRINSQLKIPKDAADLHQNLSNVSYFGNQYLVHVDRSSNDSFIYLVKGLVWSERCGAPQPVHRRSANLQFCTFSFHLLLLLVSYVFLLVYPLAATPLFPPCQLFQGPASVWSCGLYAMRLNSCTCLFTDSPKGAVRVVHHRDFPLVDAVMDSSGVHANFSHHRVSPDLSAMASPTLVVDP